MNLKLRRTNYTSRGIFGVLEQYDGTQLAVTLEHSYESTVDSHCATFDAKLPRGLYTCVRGVHQLVGHPDSFETFEVKGVAGHYGILFHVGNTNANSDGCILLGTTRVHNMVVNSQIAFDQFMEAQAGVVSFQLEVV